jgi:CheY-like chemotaxis protein
MAPQTFQFGVLREDVAAAGYREEVEGNSGNVALALRGARARDPLSIAAGHRPDVTLMDLRLPGTNGTDILIARTNSIRLAFVIAELARD